MTFTDLLARLLDADKDVITYIILFIIFLGGFSLVRSSGKADTTQNTTINTLGTALSKVPEQVIGLKDDIAKESSRTRKVLYRKLHEQSLKIDSVVEKWLLLRQEDLNRLKEIETRLTLIEAKLPTQQIAVVPVQHTGSSDSSLVKAD